MAESKVLRTLYVLGVVTIPFDAVPGFGVLGELAREGSFYLFFPALLYAGVLRIGAALAQTTSPANGSRWILWCGAALLSCVLLSGLVNMNNIGSARFHDRSGLPKFITSTCVLIYGLALAWLTAAVVDGRWYRRLVAPICVSAVVCIIVCVFERASLSGLNLAPFRTFYNLIHSGTDGPAVLWDGSLNLKALEGWDKRLRSVSFEPPAFGNFMGLAWPWLLYGVLVSHGLRRTAHIGLLLAFSALIIVAQARTGWLLLATDMGTFIGLLMVLLPKDGRTSSFRVLGLSTVVVLTALVGGLYYAMSYGAIVRTVVNGNSVSDLTRLAYQVTALKMFLANPLFGVGLGQFAFGAADFMPSWGFLSSEIRPSLIFPDAPWPNTYSIYARIGAEIGFGGLVVWIGIWILTAIAVRNSGLAHARAGGRVPWVHYTILMSIAALLISGLTTDTFRTAMIWVTLGVAADIIGKARLPQELLAERETV